jgi:hypothetical protein
VEAVKARLQGAHALVLIVERTSVQEAALLLRRLSAPEHEARSLRRNQTSQASDGSSCRDPDRPAEGAELCAFHRSHAASRHRPTSLGRKPDLARFCDGSLLRHALGTLKSLIGLSEVLEGSGRSWPESASDHLRQLADVKVRVVKRPVSNGSAHGAQSVPGHCRRVVGCHSASEGGYFRDPVDRALLEAAAGSISSLTEEARRFRGQPKTFLFDVVVSGIGQVRDRKGGTHVRQ